MSQLSKNRSQFGSVFLRLGLNRRKESTKTSHVVVCLLHIYSDFHLQRFIIILSFSSFFFAFRSTVIRYRVFLRPILPLNLSKVRTLVILELCKDKITVKVQK